MSASSPSVIRVPVDPESTTVTRVIKFSFFPFLRSLASGSCPEEYNARAPAASRPHAPWFLTLRLNRALGLHLCSGHLSTGQFLP
jgi:hypothetical protein